MNTSKMAKDIENIDFKYNPLICRNIRGALKAQAIKWINEDLRKAKKERNINMLAMCMIWAERFNLTMDDLK